MISPPPTSLSLHCSIYKTEILINTLQSVNITIVVCARGGKEFPDTRHNERRMEFIIVGDAGRLVANFYAPPDGPVSLQKPLPTAHDSLSHMGCAARRLARTVILLYPPLSWVHVALVWGQTCLGPRVACKTSVITAVLM